AQFRAGQVFLRHHHDIARFGAGEGKVCGQLAETQPQRTLSDGAQDRKRALPALRRVAQEEPVFPLPHSLYHLARLRARPRVLTPLTSWFPDFFPLPLLFAAFLLITHDSPPPFRFGPGGGGCSASICSSPLLTATRMKDARDRPIDSALALMWSNHC